MESFKSVLGKLYSKKLQQFKNHLHITKFFNSANMHISLITCRLLQRLALIFNSCNSVSAYKTLNSEVEELNSAPYR